MRALRGMAVGAGLDLLIWLLLAAGAIRLARTAPVWTETWADLSAWTVWGDARIADGYAYTGAGVLRSRIRWDHRHPITLSVEVLAGPSEGRYFCGVDLLVDDEQTYGGTWARGWGGFDSHGYYVNEGGPGGALSKRDVDAERAYRHVVRWQPPGTWTVSVNGRAKTVKLPADPKYTYLRRPYGPLHIGLGYGFPESVCRYGPVTISEGERL